MAQTTDINKAVVKFLTVKDDYTDYGFNVNNIVLQSRKEYLFETTDKILFDKLLKLTAEEMIKQDTLLAPQMRPILDWLDKEGIDYFISTKRVFI